MTPVPNDMNLLLDPDPFNDLMEVEMFMQQSKAETQEHTSCLP